MSWMNQGSQWVAQISWIINTLWLKKYPAGSHVESCGVSFSSSMPKIIATTPEGLLAPYWVQILVLSAIHPSSGCSCFYWQFTILLRNHTRKLKKILFIGHCQIHLRQTNLKSLWPLSNSLVANKLMRSHASEQHSSSQWKLNTWAVQSTYQLRLCLLMHWYISPITYYPHRSQRTH